MLSHCQTVGLRAPIRNNGRSRVIDKPHAHIMAKNDTMQASVVTAALGLLRKIMPDLQSVEMKGKVEGAAAIQRRRADGDHSRECDFDT